MVYNHFITFLKSIDTFSINFIQFFEVFKNLLNNQKSILRSFFDGSFDKISDLFFNEVDLLIKSEGAIVLDLSIGLSVNTLMNLLIKYLSQVPIVRYLIYRKRKIASRIIHSYFKIRSLLIQRSKYIEDTLRQIKDVIMIMMNPEFVLYEMKNEQQSQEVILIENENIENYEGYDEYDDGFQPPPQPIVSKSSSINLIVEKISSINIEGPRLMISAAAESVDFCPDIVIREIYNIIFPTAVVVNLTLILKKT